MSDRLQIQNVEQEITQFCFTENPPDPESSVILRPGFLSWGPVGCSSYLFLRVNYTSQLLGLAC